jgi:hypothetical protein
MDVKQIESEDEKDKSALDAFFADISCLDEIEDALGKPNIFDVLGMARAEIRHSNVLGWLLDPNGNHGLGSLFLRLFLQKLGKLGADAVKLLSADLNAFSVVREYKHIDILLVSRVPEAKIVIAIENKVDSGEHGNQLARYRQTVNEDFHDFYKEFVFLTPDGMDASEGDWRALGYKSISESLKYCLNRVDVGNEANLLLTQYLSLLEREFMDKAKLSEICNKVYREHKRALDLIFELREDQCHTTFLMISDWLKKHPEHGLDCDVDHSNKTYIRFTTKWLLGVVPRVKDGKKSGWNSDCSAYYELVNRKSGLSCKISLNHNNLDDCVFASVKKAFKLTDNDFSEGWVWKTLHGFRAKHVVKDDLTESIDQAQVDAFMDKLVKEIKAFEADKSGASQG